MMTIPKRRQTSIFSCTLLLLLLLLLLHLICLPQSASGFLSSHRPYHSHWRIKGYRQPSRITLFATRSAPPEDAPIIGSTGVGAPAVIEVEATADDTSGDAPLLKRRTVKRKVSTEKTKVAKRSQKTQAPSAEEDIAPTLTAAATKKKKVTAQKGSKKVTSTTGIAATRTAPKKKTTRKKKKRSMNTASSPDGDVDFWADANSTSEMNHQYAVCTVHGNPQPLRRHRTARGFMYNPSAAAQRCFQGVVQQVLGLTDANDDDYCATKPKKNAKSLIPLYDGAHEMDDLVPTTHFGSDTLLHLHLVCYCRRPKNHFIASRPGEGRLKLDAPSQVQRRIDVDNLAKFVLDSLNGILYADDQQVVSLHCIKVYHDDEDFLGKSVLQIAVITHDDLQIMTIEK